MQCLKGTEVRLRQLIGPVHVREWDFCAPTKSWWPTSDTHCSPSLQLVMGFRKAAVLRSEDWGFLLPKWSLCRTWLQGCLGFLEEEWPRRREGRARGRPWTRMETLLLLVSVTNWGRTVTWRQVIEMSEGPEQQQWGGLPGRGRPGPWGTGLPQWGEGRAPKSNKSSWRSNAHPREHITSYMLSVVVMATVATIIENFQKILMLDIIYRVFWDKCHCDSNTSQMAQVVKHPLAKAGDARDSGSIPGSGRSLEKEMATHSSMSWLESSMDRGAWGLQSMGSQRVRYDWACTRQMIPMWGKTTAFAQSPI